MNVVPAPITTMAWTAGSFAAAWMESRIPSGTPGLSAFTGGLSIVTTAMSSTRVSLTRSVITFSVHDFFYKDESKRPPSTISVWPVIKDDASLANSNATSAISMGCPK